MSSLRPRARWLEGLLACLGLCLLSCRGAPSIDLTPRPGPYDAIAAEDLGELRGARTHMERDEFDAARASLARLRALYPRNLAVAAMLQDVEIQAAIAERAAGAEPDARAAAVLSVLESERRRWRRAADEQPSPARLVLAARLEDDVPAALHLLDRALQADPDCIWAHYGRAHFLALRGDWEGARVSLDRALVLDPGHLPARRLQASLLARVGDPPQAVATLRAWLAAARGDPRTDSKAIAGAELDLALLLLEARRSDEARAVLEGMERRSEDPVRDWTALAAAEQGRGEPLAALRLARRAEEASPSDPLPIVQQALIQELWLEDLPAARRAWERLLALETSEGDLGGELMRLRAQVALERIEEALTARAASAFAEPVR